MTSFHGGIPGNGAKGSIPFPGTKENDFDSPFFKIVQSLHMKTLTKKQNERKLSLLPNGKPKYVRCYDNGGESFDRFTVVFTGRYTHKTNGGHWYVGMSENPFHPQGFGQHGDTEFQCVDRPTYGHLGKKISFDSLPEDCQKLVMQDYMDLWDIDLLNLEDVIQQEQRP